MELSLSQMPGSDALLVDALRAEREVVARRLGNAEQAAVRGLQNTLQDWRSPCRYETIGREFSEVSESLRNTLAQDVFADVNRLLVLDLACRLPEILPARNLPDDVIALYPAAISRLVNFLRDDAAADYYYPNEFFVKDIRFAAGLSVPCGAQIVDLRSVIGYRAALRFLARNPHPKRLIRSARDGFVGPWFRIHTESRYLDEFNEAGWNACYFRIASMLEREPQVLGMAGTSWFYDPQLKTVSPRLSYLRQRPLKGGAVLVRNRTTSYDIQSATAKSSNRRRLYQTGMYRPVSYTLLWPRETLIEWARNKRERRR
ncbi:MAG: hypothetical protein ABSD74_18465 [Rhizomicrobium sp.]|jgi:hypothetical protein